MVSPTQAERPSPTPPACGRSPEQSQVGQLRRNQYKGHVRPQRKRQWSSEPAGRSERATERMEPTPSKSSRPRAHSHDVRLPELAAQNVETSDHYTCQSWSAAHGRVSPQPQVSVTRGSEYHKKQFTDGCMSQQVGRKRVDCKLVPKRPSEPPSGSPRPSLPHVRTRMHEEANPPAIPGDIDNESMGSSPPDELLEEVVETEDASRASTPDNMSLVSTADSVSSAASTCSGTFHVSAPKEPSLAGKSSFRDKLRKRKMQDTGKSKTMRQRFNALPAEEVEAMTKVFARFDHDGSGFLDQMELVACLRELGLRGMSTAEKREIQRICCQAMAEVQTQSQHLGNMANGSSALESRIAVDLMSFALIVVPQVRQSLTDLHSHEMFRQFFHFDKDGSGKVAPDKCIEIARCMGVDRRLLWQEIENNGRGDIDFDAFQDMIVRSREQLDRMVSEREHQIKNKTGISDATFQEFRQDIVHFYDVFYRNDKDGNGVLHWDEIMCVLREFGLCPRTSREHRDTQEMLRAGDKDGNGEFSFDEFLNLTRVIRLRRLEQNRKALLKRYTRYDRDKNGKLSVEEISRLLCDIGCAPRNNHEQEEIAHIIHLVDEDGSGCIEFSEFQNLNQRIEEKLKSLRYEEDVEYAVTIGFAESQLTEFRNIFDNLDVDGSGHLEPDELNAALASMGKQIPEETFAATFAALDQDHDGSLNFREFLDFMQLMRDKEGIFAKDAQKLPMHVRFLEVRILRRTLAYFHYPKAYICTLGKDELIELFCHSFGISANDSIREKLDVRSAGELFDAAKKRGEAELRLGRPEVAMKYSRTGLGF